MVESLFEQKSVQYIKGIGVVYHIQIMIVNMAVNLLVGYQMTSFHKIRMDHVYTNGDLTMPMVGLFVIVAKNY